MVKEDSYYFFFEEGNAISKTDRRIEMVIQITDGTTFDVTLSKNLLEYFIFERLMIEGNGIGWERCRNVS